MGKLATICDVSHVISFTRPSSPLFFSPWDTKRGRPGNKARYLSIAVLGTVGVLVVL